MTLIAFAPGLIAGVTLDLLLLRTLLAPPFRIWPTPEPGSVRKPCTKLSKSRAPTSKAPGSTM